MPSARQLFLLGILLTGSASAAQNPKWSWNHGDTSLALHNHDKIVWQLNYGPDEPKTNFHPLATINGETFTAYEPDSHPWHRGLWWAWKYINGVNYWEENRQTRTSSGLSKLIDAKFEPADDFSARATLTIQYHPPGEPALLTEIRHLTVTPPDDAGSYLIDWVSTFTAGDAPVTLNRTPPPSHGGPRHGGYAGLSLRFSTAIEDMACLTSDGKNTAETAHGEPARWVAFSTPSASIAIFDHPGNLRHPQPWYAHNTDRMRFFNPSPIFDAPLELAAGEAIDLRYRIMIQSAPASPEKLQKHWNTFASMENPLPESNP